MEAVISRGSVQKTCVRVVGNTATVLPGWKGFIRILLPIRLLRMTLWLIGDGDLVDEMQKKTRRI